MLQNIYSIKFVHLKHYLSKQIMLKPFALFFLILLSFTSCDYFGYFFQKDSKRIDFTSIDEYPLFPSCDSLATLDFKEKCFEKTVAKYIQGDLEVHEFSSPEAITDAMIIHIDVDRNGKASLQELETSQKVKEFLPELEDVIRESIANFPILTPAKKRGNYVKSRYMIPIYIVE